MTDAELHARADERLAEFEALMNPANYHPLCGQACWPLDNRMLADHLKDAEIFEEVDCGPVNMIFGWLSKRYGTTDNGTPHAFSIVKVNGPVDDCQHTLFAPTINALGQIEFSATDTNGIPLTEDN